jgi:uncharacterized protein YndB with AHSA1/START domain
LALQRIEQQRVETCWSDAGSLVPPEWAFCGDADYAGGTVLSLGYRILLQATPEEVWQPLSRIGGRTGWYYGDSWWAIRGGADRLLGGSGLRRGRRHPTDLRLGDALDFFRVLEIEPPHRLLLVAEMKMPGEATLEFRLSPRPDGVTELTQVARFLPRGLLGIAYWYLLDPFHKKIYPGMLRGLAAATGKPIIAGPERVGSKS